VSYEEYLGWLNFFERQPPGWREDLRTYYIMSSMSGSKTKPEDIFPSIAQLRQSEIEAEKAARSFKKSPFFTQMKKVYKEVGKEI
jgi:hypothetical protein